MTLTSLVLIAALAQSITAATVRHNNPAGFTLEHPQGWVVKTPDTRTVLVQSPDGSSFVMIQGFVERERKAAQWMSASLMRGIAIFPDAETLSIRQQSARPDTVLAPVSFIGSRGPARANLLCAIAGGAGTLMAIAAPKNQFEAQRAVLGAILQSFSFTAAAAPGGQSAPAGPARYVRFVDPRERAFSVEVPQDWRTQGGLFRYAPVDVRAGLETVSSDGQIRITAGDPRIPTFVVPTPTLTMDRIPRR